MDMSKVISGIEIMKKKAMTPVHPVNSTTVL